MKCLRMTFCLALLGLALVVPSMRADDKPAKPTVDVVICLDVSSSMNGLIDSARIKLWDIINDLGKAKPAPVLRVGLYSYGHNSYDPNKGWVRKEADLTTDLDEVYKKLNGLTIYGGTEYVARVCRDAINEQKWSEEKKSLKMIFVCGNEPVDQDKQVDLKDVAQMALKKDIIINTIYCTRPRFEFEGKGWQDFAKMAEGSYAAIDQKKGTVAIAAPQDKKLAELSTKLNSTYVAYGKKDVRDEKVQNQTAQDANAGKLAPAAAATRGIAKGGAHYRNSDWDLVDRLRDDPKLDITKIPEAELCDELRKLKPEERVAYVKKKQDERFAIQKEIVDLSKQRDDYVRTEMKKNAKEGQQVFDAAVRGAVREQANRKGIKIPE